MGGCSLYQLSRSALHRKLGKNAFTSALVKAVIITAKEILLNGCSLQRESSMREGNVIRTGPWVIYLLLGLPGQQDALLPARGGWEKGAASRIQLLDPARGMAPHTPVGLWRMQGCKRHLGKALG